MNEEWGMRDGRRAEAGPDTGQGTPDGHPAGPALERGRNAPSRAGAGSWAGADGPAGADVATGPGRRPQRGKRPRAARGGAADPAGVALVLALLIMTRGQRSSSSSMENTLVGDKVLVS
jgi:hypothetical protein